MVDPDVVRVVSAILQRHSEAIVVAEEVRLDIVLEIAEELESVIEKRFDEQVKALDGAGEG